MILNNPPMKFKDFLRISTSTLFEKSMFSVVFMSAEQLQSSWSGFEGPSEALGRLCPHFGGLVKLLQDGGVFQRFWWSVGEDTGGGESNTRLCTLVQGSADIHIHKTTVHFLRSDARKLQSPGQMLEQKLNF